MNASNSSENRPSDSVTASAMASRGVLLGFSDSDLEHEYQSQEHADNLRRIAVGLGVAIALTVFYVPFDTAFIDPQFVSLAHWLRLGVLTPATVFGFVCVFVIRDVNVWIRCMCAALTVYGVTWSSILYVCGAPLLNFAAIALAETIIGAYVLLGLPVRWSASCVLIVTSAYTVVALTVGTRLTESLYWILNLLTLSGLATFGSFRYEAALRRRFLAIKKAEFEYRQRLNAEHERRRWLEGAAGFLRHELKNSITGIVSSLELVTRSENRTDTQRYLNRASQSASFMRRFLQQAADATSLESALAVQETEPVNIAELATEFVDGLSISNRGRELEFTIDVDSNIMVLGNADSLLQMVEKLVGNAVEHTGDTHPISVSVRTDNAAVRLVVENRGDPLPTDLEAIFEPFVSNKIRPAIGSMGLGLYVAKVIATHHGGAIVAERLETPTGARFIVTLPVYIQQVAGLS